MVGKVIEVLVVDDEPLARRGVLARLRRHPDVRVVAECATAREAAAALRAVRPAAIFLDVEMPGLSGLEFAELIGEEAMPLVVLVTAHEEHALAAFDIPVVDYLLKPIEDVRFDRAIARLRRAHARGASVLDAAADRIAVPSDGRMTMVPYREITWIEADGDHVVLHTSAGDYRLRTTFHAFLRKLPAEVFRQVHRSTGVNVAAIAHLSPLPNREFEIRLRDGTRLRLSRTHRDALRDLLPSG